MDLNLKKYNRIFMSGCSFTHYRWPTWADIIAKEVGEEKCFNYGISGAGNLYITHSIIECDLIHKFTSNDLVMVMFTNFHREDRYIQSKGGWALSGNIYTQDVFDDNYLNYWDDDFAYMRDLMFIRLLRNYLQNKGIDYHFMSMVSIGDDMHGDDNTSNYQKKLLEYYKDDIAVVKPSIHQLIFDGDWKSRKPRSITPSPNAIHPIYGVGWYEDNHAHPLEHLEYLQKLWPETKFQQSTLDYADYWHQRVLDKKDIYTKHLIDRKLNQRLDSTFFN